ncbi:MAG: hypothetical protein JJ863_25770 [Deltaproteobacteria bacterium]|nr:hypothetical protein [Deltaproteobacteria bacterium]
MRWTLSTLTLVLACATTSEPEPITANEASRDQPVTPGAEVAEAEPEAPVVAHRVGLGPTEGCAAVGSRLRCWGSIFLSPGDPGPEAGVRTLPFSFPSIAHLEVAEGSACVIDEEGVLKCFGAVTDELRYEEIANLEAEGASIEEIEALEQGPYLAGYGRGVVDVAIGIGGLCWVLESGAVDCAGIEPETEVFSVPHRFDDARRIALTDDHVCVLRDGGEVSCWGLDEAGVGLSPARTDAILTHRDLPGTDIIAGLGFTCVLGTEGQVTCWGDGLLDVDLFTDEEYERTEYPHYTWPDVQAVQIEAGELHACARTEGGRVICMGENEIGQLGDGSTRRRPTPVEADQLEGARSIVLGTNTTCAVIESGLRCVGDGSGGAFDGSKSPPRWARVFTGARDVFLDRSGHRVCAIDEQDRARCVGHDRDGGLLEAIRRRLPEGMAATSRAMASIDGHHCTLDTAGTLDCGSRRNAPPSRRNVAQVVSGSRTLCVRHQNGDVACLPTRTGSSPVVSGEGWQTIDAYAGATEIAVDDLGSALCAVFRSGRVACRGLDVAPLAQVRNATTLTMSTGAVCVATRDEKALCVRGGHLAAPVDDVIDVGYYDLHPCFLMKSGEVHCERRGRAERLGDLSGVRRIVGRRWSLCALTESGEVHCHGRGLQGELGLIPEGIAIEAIELDPFGA